MRPQITDVAFILIFRHHTIDKIEINGSLSFLYPCGIIVGKQGVDIFFIFFIDVF